MFQPPVNSSASGGALEVESKDMQPNMGGVVHPVGGISQTHHLHQHLHSASPSQQYAVEEQITTVRIPMVTQLFTFFKRMLSNFGSVACHKLSREKKR